MPNDDNKFYTARRRFVVGLFLAVAGALVWRAVDLQLARKEFLQDHGDARYLRTVQIPAHRGMITDRNGELLAVSTPVSSVWAMPGELVTERERWPELTKLLGLQVDTLEALIEPRMNREFAYLKRHVDPHRAQQVMDLGVSGVYLKREYRRYYPLAEVAAHIVGFTNIDDEGQEGLELAFDSHLRGTPGAKRVIKDRLGHIVKDVESIKTADPGDGLALSIDKRLQYVAYRELKAAVQSHHAGAGSVVILDVATGEVLAMASQPSYNPNDRGGLRDACYRNRALTDVFEPGSTIKPFTVAAALETGAYRLSSLVDTTPGYFKVGRHTVRDLHDYGILDVPGILTRSSNVGASKIALSLGPESLWNMFRRLGFGAVTYLGFPGESAGRLNHYQNWWPIDQATLAFGYGLSVTSLQLARAYLVLANDGLARSVSILPEDAKAQGEQVMSRRTAQQLRRMLEAVVEQGTGQRAQVPGYRVAGKTGTVHKTAAGGYAKDRYIALFAGILPASRPRLVAVVMIDEPSNGTYFGGDIAAPVFAKIAGHAVRLMNITPDNLSDIERPARTYMANNGTQITSLARR